MSRPILNLFFALVLVSIGALAGWLGARPAGQAAPQDDAAHAGGLSEQTLKNLGVRVEDAKLETFTRAINVQATVVDAPLNRRPLTAPLGGVVVKLHVQPGDVVKAGDPVATVVRDPIKRPQLSLTADILTPVSEDLHEAVASLRLSRAKFEIAQAEWKRIQPFVKEGVLPRKRLIDLDYERRRAQSELEIARHELEWHGLSDTEIDEVAKGARPPTNRRLWKRALEKNDLWGRNEETILQSLPARDRDLPWSVAAIGELSAAGLATGALVEALAEVPHMSQHFVETAALLLEGHSVARTRWLCEAGAFEARAAIRAPRDGAPDFDVSSIDILPGQMVAPGETVAVLHDARMMWLRVEPLGAEVRAVKDAMAAGTPMAAVPLLARTGPDLDGLRIERLDTRAGFDDRGAVAIITCANEPLKTGGDDRSWALRVGLRYLVKVPAQSIGECFVLPAGAVAQQGPDRVVFLQDGKTFRAEPVHVLHEDDDVVVVAHDGTITQGDPVVTSGAFALSLALQDTGGAHQGHGHPHPH
jgi:multidrug efflux pump subunit AcrA (membrane-fusion protein)